MIAADLETYPIAPKQVAPKVVCLATATDQGPVLFGNGDPDFERRLEALFEGPSVWHNGAFDLTCIASWYPRLIPRIFSALEEGLVWDTLIREKLLNLATFGSLDVNPAGKRISYSLAFLARKHLGLDLFAQKEGDDIWRVRFHELDGLRAKDYPAEAAEYAKSDAKVTFEILQAQERKAPPGCFRCEPLHVKAAFCLQAMTVYGLLVDKEAKETLAAKIEEALSPDRMAPLYEAKILRPAIPPSPSSRKDHRAGCSRKDCDCPTLMKKAQPEKVNVRAALHPRIEEVCKKHGFSIPLTPTGRVSASEEVLRELAPLDPILELFHERQKVVKLKTSYLPSLEWPLGSGKTAEVVHPQYDPLKETGRVSSYGVSKRTKNPLFPSVAIQLADPRMRHVFRPRDGYLFAVADYNAIDLCSLAQTMKRLFGRSTHLDQINSGLDPHSVLGAVLAYDGDAEFRKEAGGKADKEVYDLFLSKKKSDPQWFKHWRTFAKPVGLGYPGGMGAATMVKLCASYGLKIDEAHARHLKNLWLQVYPEMKLYLDSWVPSQGDTYVSPSGMIRTGCSYTQLANGVALQTPAAEGMKEAMFLVTRACYDPDMGSVLYGSKPVINMHDELVVEVDTRDGLHRERAEELGRLMVEGMRKILPDVHVRAEPSLQERWTKDAKNLLEEDQ